MDFMDNGLLLLTYDFYKQVILLEVETLICNRTITQAK